MSSIILPYDKQFFDEYGVYIKPVDYPLSSKKIDSLQQIAYMQKYFQCNPIQFIDIMFNIELFDFQALFIEKSWFCKNTLAVMTRGAGKSTVVDLQLMAKDMLFTNYWAYISSGSGDQAEQTFMTLQKLANDSIETFQGSTGKIFKNEIQVKAANGDGFSHNPNGFIYTTYNGSFTQTLNSNVDKKRGFYQRNITLIYDIEREINMRKNNIDWNNQEIEFLRNNYYKMSYSDLRKKLNKSDWSIRKKAKELGLVKQLHKNWTILEDDFIRNNYLDMTSEQLAEVLNRTVPSVNERKNRLGLSKLDKWTQEEIDYLMVHYQNDEYKNIADVLGKTYGSVNAKVHDLHLFKKEPDWSDEEIAFVKQYYSQMQTKEIAEKLGRSMTAISLKAKRLGLKKYPYTCNYHFFETIDTEEKAYWLGFFTADGWMNKNDENNAGCVGFELQYGDINHLKKFNKSINGNYRITDRWRACTLHESNKKHHVCCIRVFSILMYNSLIKLGFSSETKTYDVRMPKIPDMLMRHYLRGYFDGDGCFTFTDKSFGVSFITASKGMNDDIREYLSKIGFTVGDVSYISDYGTHMYRPELYKQEDKIRFLDYIYQDSNIYLDRKYNKYLRVKDYYGKTESLASQK